MKRQRLSDRELLRRLLDSGCLSPSEESALREKFDDISSIARPLDPRTRLWGEFLYFDKYQVGLALANTRRLDNRRRQKAEARAAIAKLEAMPRPKKPPGL